MIGGSDEHGVPITLRAKKEGITHRRMWWIVTTVLSRNRSRSSASRLISIHVLLPLRIIRWPRIFSVHCMIKANSSRKQASNTTMRRRSNSWPTVISRVLVRIVETRRHMATSEACGTSLSPTDLKDPKSAISGSKPVMRETKHWYLPLDKWEPFLRKWILEDHKEW